MIGDLKMCVGVRTKDTNVVWLGASGLTLHVVSRACKGSEIKTFDSNVKQKVLNGENR